MKLAFDIGGTFTDVLFIDATGRVTARKLPSLLELVGDDIALLVQAAATDEQHRFVHATTICSNALLEGLVAETGLVTSRGFRDVLEMRNQRRPNVNDVTWQRPRPLVPRRRVAEVAGRVLAQGSIDEDLDPEELTALTTGPLEGVAAVAVCLINAHANPEHELRVAAAIRDAHPGVPICVSTEQFREMGEYERMSTTCVNASLMPIVDDYLSRLERQLGTSGPGLLIMQSNGGLMDSKVARERPAHMIESGPAAGVLAAAELARRLDLTKALAFDMGGTTAKASAILDGRPLERPQAEVGGDSNLASRFFGGSGHVVRVTSLDIVEVGAGGGSIAWVDSGGRLRVGPRGAGAEPGPACYGRGGTRPTVTDANVVLGYINSTAVADGTVPIDADAAARAINDEIAVPLAIDIVDAALGIVQVANATMRRALRAVTVEKGHDPRDFAIVAFGGAGPVHAAQLAAALDVATVYIPPLPGVFSAVGLMLANYRHDAAVGLVIPVSSVDDEMLDREFGELKRQLLATLADEGVPTDSVMLQHEIDMQYHGQDETLTVQPPAVDAGDATPSELGRHFGDAHRKAFGYELDDAIDVVALRLRATARIGTSDLSTILASSDGLPGRERGAPSARTVYFDDRRAPQEAEVATRADLRGEPREGALVLDEPDTTVLVPPGWRAALDDQGNVVLTSKPPG